VIPPGDAAGRALFEPSYARFRDTLASSDCRRCGLAEGRTNIVVDRGDPSARTMIIGEAPGRDEDLAGRAFVGRAGRLLDALLAENGLDPGRDVFIANVVKCRPPGNRPPRPEEAGACLPFLRRQVELVGPEAVILLGATAARRVLGDRTVVMHREAGVIREFPGRPGTRCTILFHPAYLLRDPRKKDVFRNHLGAFLSRLR
jgi:uracil-DNA glycosylase family 4